MKTYLLLIFLSSTTFLLAQSKEYIDDEFELSMAILSSSPLLIERDHPIDGSKISIYSEASRGYNFGLKYLRKQTNRVNWILGFETGRYSANINYVIQKDFIDLGERNPYTHEYTESFIFYIAPEIGARYTLSRENRKGKLVISASVMAAYHLNTGLQITRGLNADTSRSSPLFFIQMESKNRNHVVLAPKLNLEYSYQITPTKTIFIGFTSTFSNQTPFEGRYLIQGDNEVLEGRIKKRYNFSGFKFGYRGKLTTKTAQ